MERIGHLLQKTGVIDEKTLDAALALQQKQDNSGKAHERLGDCLIRHFNAGEEPVYRSLAMQCSMPFLPEIDSIVDRNLIQELSIDVYKTKNCLPLEQKDDILRAVVSDPLDLGVILTIQALTGLVIEANLTTPSRMNACRQGLLEGSTLLQQSAGKISREYEKQLGAEDAMSIEEMKKKTESEPVVKMATLIFNEAIALNASDIHIEPTEYNANVRYRIDGMLSQHMEMARGMYVPLTSRIKIMADLDIAEKRVPQDGRIRYTHRDETYDFRVSTLPTHHGEKTVIRLLKHDMGLLELSRIGIPDKEYGLLCEHIEKPQGIIFVTGPTGSGKSSTLFACLNRIRGKAINITTIENPIEYKLEGVNQVQINEKAGVTFAATLRSILRQDPDVILIGEIRDRETAEIAVQASQTGHLVLSTLHTNDAISAITRLRDLGIPGFLISSSLLAILAQRLVRVLCPKCRKPAALDNEIRERWRIMLGGIPLPRSYTPAGCDACHGVGYRGRTGIFELAAVNDDLRTMIAENATESAIRAYYRSAGMITMIQNGIDKIERGVTSPEELLRVVMVEDLRGMQKSTDSQAKDSA
jgi:type IV pilus assembly protein PilB